MKKYFLLPLLVVLVPEFVFGASARYTQLVREKQRKMEQLEKCMGASKGLQIAGVSTLGLTAVGVAGNIAEAKIISDNTKIIDKKNKEIQSAQKELADKQAENAKKEADAKILAECKTQLNDQNITSAEKDSNGNCKVLDCADGYAKSENECILSLAEKVKAMTSEELRQATIQYDMDKIHAKEPSFSYKTGTKKAEESFLGETSMLSQPTTSAPMGMAPFYQPVPQTFKK